MAIKQVIFGYIEAYNARQSRLSPEVSGAVDVDIEFSINNYKGFTGVISGEVTLAPDLKEKLRLWSSMDGYISASLARYLKNFILGEFRDLQQQLEEVALEAVKDGSFV